jgi:hypothetical protein
MSRIEEFKKACQNENPYEEDLFDEKKFSNLILKQVEQTIQKYSNLFEIQEFFQVLIKMIKKDLGVE